MPIKKIFCIILLCLFTLILAQEATDKEKDKKSKESAKVEKKEKKKDDEELVTPDEKYRTPRAGKSLKGSLFGMDIHVPARERDKTTAISLGAAIYSPDAGSDSVIPFAAFYYTDTWEEKDRRLRAIIAIAGK